jgi:hypothetical protein
MRDGDLAPHEPVVAGVHRGQEAWERRQVRQMAHGAFDSRTAGFVFPPDVVDRLARDRKPTARFARDLDHALRVRRGPPGRAPPPASYPLPTVRLTLPPCRRWVPAFGLCEITRPFATLLENAFVTFPTEQKCALSACFATERA